MKVRLHPLGHLLQMLRMIHWHKLLWPLLLPLLRQQKTVDGVHEELTAVGFSLMVATMRL